MNFWFRLPLRTRLGIISFVFLTCVIVLLLTWHYTPERFSYRDGWILRFGPLIFLFWLAWEDLIKIPWWNWLIILALMIAGAIKPGVWFIGIPVIGYILFTGRKK